MANESRLTYKRSLDGFDDVGLREGVTVGEAICKLADLEERDILEVVRCKDCEHGIWDEENEMWRCVESAEYDSDFGDYIGFTSYHNADYFCADGERRKNG